MNPPFRSARAALLLIGLLPAACAVTPPPDTAVAPPNAWGVNADPDVSAINVSAWAFADPARTRGRPIDAARAAAAVDYMGGELTSSPRWDFVSPLTKLQMEQARVELRQALGIAQNAPSQVVVDDLLTAANALVAGDQAAAEAALPPQVFTLGPQQTLARLANLPYLPTVNFATMRASMQTEQPTGNPCITCN